MIFGMKRQQAFKLAVISGSAVLLQGCVAAVVPLAAGGLLTRSAAKGEESDGSVEVARAAQPDSTTVSEAAPVASNSPEVEAAIAENVAAVEALDGDDAQTGMDLAEAAPPVSAEPEVVETAAAVEPSAPPVETAATQNPVAIAVPAPAQSATITVPDADAAIAADVSTPTAPAPVATASAVTAAAPRATPLPAQGVVTLFDPLVGYATAQQSIAADARVSAMLSDPAALRPARIACTGGTPTVVIDLDPEGENLPVSEQLNAPSALGVKLAQMRAQGIDIAWISQVSADQEGAVRAALTRSGLDLAGTDQLLLIRTPDERKQSRRDELAEDACIVAIAGDTRSDFHELFDYLLNPNDAFALQTLIGDGWFIIPTPLLPEGLNR